MTLLFTPLSSEKTWSSGTLKTPLGTLGLIADPLGIIRVSFQDEIPPYPPSLLIEEAISQLKDYFAKKRKTFHLPLHLPPQTPFKTSVYEALSTIPYGKTITYGKLAELAGYPKAYRAVGKVMASNPLPLFLPCHRVVGIANPLAYGAGAKVKVWLLSHEGAQ